MVNIIPVILKKEHKLKTNNFKQIVSSLTICSSISILSACNGGIKTPTSPTIILGQSSTKASNHDNNLILYYSGDLDKEIAITYESNVKITANQPVESFNVSILENNTYGEYQELTLIAGRKNSKEVGQDFFAKTNNNFAFSSDSQTSSRSDVYNKSNFNYEINLSISGHTLKDHLIIDQYQAGSRNQWAVGSISGSPNNDGHGLTVYTEESDNYTSEAYCISHLNENDSKLGVNEWFIKQGSCSNIATIIKGTERDNQVFFTAYTSDYKVSLPVKFTPEEIVVTSGQPYHKEIGESYIQQDITIESNGVVFGRVEGGSYYLAIKSGRKGAKDTALKFNQAISNNSTHAYRTDGGNSGLPEKLNFYLKGALEINGEKVSQPVYIGQGHYVFVTGLVWGSIYMDMGLLIIGYTQGSALGLLIGGGMTTVGAAMDYGAVKNNWWLASNAIEYTSRYVIITKSGSVYKISSNAANSFILTREILSNKL